MKQYRLFNLSSRTAAILVSGLLACGGGAKKPSAVQSGLEDYIRQARSLPVDNREAQGSLWSESSRISDTYRDLRAYRPADIVTIQVVESTVASNEASTESTKSSEVNTQLPGLGGAEKRISELPNLFDTTHSTEFEGDASTSRRSALRTSIAARVVEVFPNGLLLVEGNREILINNERQIVIVRGVVRPEDISPQNVVLSTQIAELEIELKGRGIVSRAQKPGVLFKILSGIWPF